MDFRLLGPLEVEDRGRPLPVAGAKERAVLALLLLRANELVSRELLIDDLWGERPPATAKHTLEAYVSRLRKALARGGNGALIESRPGGYLIRLDPDRLDARRFERLLEQGQSALAAGAAEQAEETLAAALALWRGEALADLALEPFAAVEAGRLEELRLAALEARLEAALALGRHRELVAELQSLVATHPLRERLRGQLMLALYRSGRQADALQVYQEGRRRLVDELGIEPGRELQQLQGAILRHDPGLEAPAPRAGDGRAGAAPDPASRSGRVATRSPIAQSGRRAQARALVGRREECSSIEALLANARDGASGTLVLRGEPGIGKSALLDYAAERAEGMTVVWACGAETESELSFAGLADVLRPLLSRLEALPARQREVLAGALALGPPAAADPLAIGAATLGLLTVAAEGRPLVVLVDDAPWLESSSRQALLFAARRLGASPIAMLFAVRHGDVPSDLSGFDEIELSPLREEEARALLSRGPALAGEVADRVVAAAGGNPLALLAIPEALTERQRAGLEPLEDPLPAGARLGVVFGKRLARLPRATREALVVAAASESPDIADLARALARLGIPASAFEPAESAGLVHLADVHLQFAHPVVRSAAYHGADPALRRRAHGALADALPPRDSARAWHRAAATVALDEDAAAELEAAGRASSERHALSEAAAAFSRAAALSADPGVRARRLLEAARAFRATGQHSAVTAALDEALGLGPDPPLRAAIQQLRWRGVYEWPDPDAFDVLVAEADAVEAVDPERAASLLVDAAKAGLEGGGLPDGLAAARRAMTLVEGTETWTETAATAMLANALVWTGDAAAARPLLDACAARVADDRWIAEAPMLPADIGVSLVWIEDYERAGNILEQAVRAARTAGAAATLAHHLLIRSELHYRTGRWWHAYADATEHIALCRAAGREPNYFRIARLEALCGREAECRRYADLQELRFGTVGASGLALGLLELGQGRPRQAVEHFEAIAPHIVEGPAVLSWAPDLVEAYVRSGRRAEAETLFEQFDVQASRSGRALDLAAAARCRGLLAATAFDADFESALSWHVRTPTPFERARTELCYGERLRRAGRRTEARSHLRSALDAFADLGASPWTERALHDLRATGETARRRDQSTAGELTPQELQVACVVAEGASNKEAAAALFVSPRTIEFHLGNVYRKLGVRSRTELARRLVDGTPDAA